MQGSQSSLTRQVCAVVLLLLPCGALPPPAAKAWQLPVAATDAGAAGALDALYRAGYDAYGKGDLATAHTRFARLVTLAPRLALAHMVYGEVLLAEGRSSMALEQLTLAQQLDPKAAATETALAQTWLALGNNDKAAAAFARARGKGALPSPDETRDEAGALAATGHAAEAMDALVTALHPVEATASALSRAQTGRLEDALGTLLAHSGKLDEATEHFIAAAAADPALPSAHAHLGAAMLAQHQPPEAALPELQRAVTLAPQNAVYALELGQTLAAAGQASRAVEVLRRAMQLAELHGPAGGAAREHAATTQLHGAAAAANRAQQTALAQEPFQQAAYALSLALQASGEASAALPLLSRYVAAHPSDTAALTNYALALVQTGDARMAVRIYAQAVTHGPDDATLREDFGVAYLQQSDLDQALEQFRAGLALQPDNPHLHYDLGLAYKLKDNLPAAIAEFEQAEALDPSLPDPPYTLGVLRMQQGNFPAAAVQLEQAVALRPDNGAAWAVLGNVYKENGNAAQATAALRKAIELDPSQPSTHISLGALLAQAGDGAAARTERSIAADLSRAAVSRQRASFALKSGRALAAQGKLKDAETQLRTALEAAPLDPAAHNALAEVLMREGRLADAALERKAAVSPTGAALAGSSPAPSAP